jgi:hypothetical protein
VTDQNWIIDTVASTRYPVYTRLNANDVMADPITPLGASLVWVPEVLPGWAVGNVRLNAFTPEEMSPDPYPPVAGFFYGYLYVDQTYVRITGIRAGIGSDAIEPERRQRGAVGQHRRADAVDADHHDIPRG